MNSIQAMCFWATAAFAAGECWPSAYSARCTAVFRVCGSQRSDLRHGRRLGPGQRLVQWQKPSRRPKTVSEQQWALLPEKLSLRVVVCHLAQRGFRTQKLLVVTTLLDAQRYDAEALGQLYRRRWEMELTLRHLKTTLQMEILSCKTPANLERELRMHLLVYNLMRRLMFESTQCHRVPLNRISFAGTLAAARRCAEALLQVRSAARRKRLLEELFRVLASDLVPYRPGRREPRAVKRRPKPYTRLMCHRHKFREIQHQNRYYTNSIFDPKYRKSSKP